MKKKNVVKIFIMFILIGMILIVISGNTLAVNVTSTNSNYSSNTTNSTENNTTNSTSKSTTNTTSNSNSKTTTTDYNLNKAIEEYNKLSVDHTNEEIAEILEQNEEAIKTQTGISQDVIDAGKVMLITTNQDELKEILNNDEVIKDIQKRLENGEQPADAVASAIKTTDSLYLVVKMLLANKIVMGTVFFVGILALIIIIVEGVIFHKAGKHGWATIIPIYRDIVYYQVCGINPCVLLLLLLPVIGWMMLLIINIVSKFKLAKGFGHGFFFGLFVWLLPIIFETAIALQSKPYVGFDEED